MSAMTLTIADQTSGFGLTPDHTPMMRFNPTSHTLSKRIHDLSFKIGLGNTEYLRNLPSTATKAQIDVESIVELLSWNVTSASYWTIPPTIINYDDLENLNDVEEIESLLYQTSKKFSW
jgi:hypothetical protein